MKRQSDTYLRLVDLLFRTEKMTTLASIWSHSVSNGEYACNQIPGNSHKIRQPMVIQNTELFEIAESAAELLLLRRIALDMKEYNVLWNCPPEVKRSSKARAAIKKFLLHNLLIKTETTNIYIVNPLYIRRGDILGCISTTATMLMDEPRVGVEHIVNKRPVKHFNSNQHLLENNSTEPTVN